MISHHLNLKLATHKPYLKEISASMNLTAILASSKYRAPPRPARIALSRSYGHTYDLAKAPPLRVLLLLLLPPLPILLLHLILFLPPLMILLLVLVLSEEALAVPYASTNHRYLRLWLVYWYWSNAGTGNNEKSSIPCTTS